MDEIICPSCKRDTSYTTDHTVLYNTMGAPANKSRDGYFLLQPFECPKCWNPILWSMKTALEVKKMRAVEAVNQRMGIYETRS